MEGVQSEDVVAYVVWVQVYRAQDAATLQANAAQTQLLIPGSDRVMHFSDPDVHTGKAYSPVIGVPYQAPAWDVYLAFGPDAEWNDAPPVPAYWEHQLGGMPRKQRLDGERFAGMVEQLLAAERE